MLEIGIDRDCCMGSGMCSVYAPGTFTQDAFAKAIVLDPDADPIDSIRIAVDACPTGALQFRDTEVRRP